MARRARTCGTLDVTRCDHLVPSCDSPQVVIDISEPEVGNTVVKVKQTCIPAHDKFGNEDTVDVTEKGWHGQVLNRIRQVFGYGA